MWYSHVPTHSHTHTHTHVHVHTHIHIMHSQTHTHTHTHTGCFHVPRCMLMCLNMLTKMNE